MGGWEEKEREDERRVGGKGWEKERKGGRRWQYARRIGGRNHDGGKGVGETG